MTEGNPIVRDPMVALWERHKRLLAAPDADDDNRKWRAIERKGIATRPTTIAGVIASLEWIRFEHHEKYDDCDPDSSDYRLMLALIDGALDVLRLSKNS